ncbi:MAG: ferredoxin [Actinobacteria bacterium]|nr:ferredoxin [Actinomycetota bacterium]
MSDKKKTPPTLVLNPIMCDGRGMCHDAAPDLIDLDEWGYPLLPSHGLRAELSRAQMKAAEDATHACPVLALHIER